MEVPVTQLDRVSIVMWVAERVMHDVYEYVYGCVCRAPGMKMLALILKANSLDR